MDGPTALRATGTRSTSERRRPLHEAITEALIRRLVFSFYDRIRADQTLGPLFHKVIGDNWGPHLEKMCDFWSSVMRMSGRYKGQAMRAHLRLKSVRPEHFEIWLDHFRHTAYEICDPEVAPLFIQRAEMIAESLKLGMFFRPGGSVSGPEIPHEGQGAL